MDQKEQGFDFDQRPFLVIWETTRACDLACIHCRASADSRRAPDELNFEEGVKLINDVREMGTPILIFSGGDCLKRDDLTRLIAYAKSVGLRTGAIPAVTSNLTERKIAELKEAGLDQIAFSLDAAKAADHDIFRQTTGVFERTLKCIDQANQAGLRVQINSLINVHNENQLDGLMDLIDSFDLVFWEIFFLVPVGRGEDIPLMTADKFEEAFEKIYKYSQGVKFITKITEAPHYRRFCHEQTASAHLKQKLERTSTPTLPDDLRMPHYPRKGIQRAPAGVNSGKGFAFVSYRGDIMPSGFLPLAAGNIRQDSLADIYRESTLFKTLRNTSLLEGRCGVCTYKDVCGGSRARAYAMTGNYLGEDPCCSYQPKNSEQSEHRV